MLEQRHTSIFTPRGSLPKTDEEGNGRPLVPISLLALSVMDQEVLHVKFYL
eukprot:SAG31_NODE_14829_length_785_cov_1.489796_2_plen_50_part_01